MCSCARLQRAYVTRFMLLSGSYGLSDKQKNASGGSVLVFGRNQTEWLPPWVGKLSPKVTDEGDRSAKPNIVPREYRAVRHIVPARVYRLREAQQRYSADAERYAYSRKHDMFLRKHDMRAGARTEKRTVNDGPYMAKCRGCREVELPLSGELSPIGD